MAKPPLTLVHGFVPPIDVRALAVDKLASSGLTTEDAKELGITWHPGGEVVKMSETFWARPALRLNYYGPDNSRLLLRPRPDWPEFFRVRALTSPGPTDASAAKFRKYLQPPETGVCAYFPRLVDWEVVSRDRKRPIIITEGELKAAKATKEGYPTIGLGGVWSFRSRNADLDFLPELDSFTWARREVSIVYDSDVQGNSQVRKALHALAEKLTLRGALVATVMLPVGEKGEKVGLDDFFVNNPTIDLSNFITDRRIPLSYGAPLWDLNERFAYVRETNTIVEVNYGKFYGVEAFKVMENATYCERVVGAKDVTYKDIPAAAKWLTWQMRQDVRRLTYSPGEDPLALIPSQTPDDEELDSEYNTWRGWGTKPQEGSVDLFLQLLEHLFEGAPEATKLWFLRWCAYPIQHPGVKLFSSAVLYGLEQGTGKSLFGYSLGRVYGRNFTEINQTDLHGPFNEWAVGKQLIMGDDVTGSDKRQDLDLLKKMITQLELRVNVKYQPSYTVPDCVNYLWTSNQPNAFFLEDKDRRFFIHEVTAAPLPPGWGSTYRKWLNGKGGPAIHDYLLNLDLGNWDPAAPALATDAKSQMTRTTRSDIGNWVRDLLEDPDTHLMLMDAPVQGDLHTNKALMTIYQAASGDELGSRLTPGRLGIELARAGCLQVHGGKPVSVPGLKTDRYYAIRNRERWAKATLPELQAHLGPAPEAPPPPAPKRRY